MATDIPSREALARLIDYNPHTGDIRWKPRTAADFPNSKYPERDAKRFNSQHAGKTCCTAHHVATNGRQAVVLGWHGVAHRLVWWMHYGEQPEEIEAISGNFSDLRIVNFKASARIYTGKNTTAFKNNTSGVRGVHWDSARQLWRAEIKANGKVYSLGRFTTIERAAKAREAAQARHGFDLRSKPA
jgi:AP2 domain